MSFAMVMSCVEIPAFSSAAAGEIPQIFAARIYMFYCQRNKNASPLLLCVFHSISYRLDNVEH